MYKIIVAISLLFMAAGCNPFEAKTGGGRGGLVDTECTPATFDSVLNVFKIGLAWDAVTQRLDGTPIDPSTDPVGYRVFYGIGTRTYDTQIDVGLPLEIRVDNLAPNTYYFAIKAYWINNPSSQSNGYSNEICATYPANSLAYLNPYETVATALEKAVLKANNELEDNSVETEPHSYKSAKVRTAQAVETESSLSSAVLPSPSLMAEP